MGTVVVAPCRSRGGGRGSVPGHGAQHRADGGTATASAVAPSSPLPQPGDAQQLPHIAVRDGGLARRARQLRDHQQHLRILRQRADLALGHLQRVHGPVARLQRAHRGHVVILGLVRIGRSAARQQVELGGADVVRLAQGLLRGALVEQGGFPRIGGLLGHPAGHRGPEHAVLQLGGAARQQHAALQRPRLGGQRAQLPQQVLAHGLAVGGLPLGRALVLGVRQLPERPERVAVDLRVGRVQRGLQRGARVAHLADGDLPLREQQPQARVVRIAAQQGCAGRRPRARSSRFRPAGVPDPAAGRAATGRRPPCRRAA